MPLAEAVVFAMIASFILSRTLVPTMALYLLKPHSDASNHQTHGALGFLSRFQRRFEAGFETFRESYRNLLAMALAHAAPS